MSFSKKKFKNCMMFSQNCCIFAAVLRKEVEGTPGFVKIPVFLCLQIKKFRKIISRNLRL